MESLPRKQFCHKRLTELNNVWRAMKGLEDLFPLKTVKTQRKNYLVIIEKMNANEQDVTANSSSHF